MLPDLPELKANLLSVFMIYLQRQVRSRMPGLNEAPQHVLHEGARMRIVRANGEVETTELKRASSEFSIGKDEAATMTPQQRMEKLNLLAEDMARQISQHAFASINETLDAAGQVVDQKGRPIDAQGILAMLEKIQLEFGEDGHVKNLTIVTGSELHAHLPGVFKQLQTDLDLKAKYDALLLRKWVAWRDREASRKLVG